MRENLSRDMMELKVKVENGQDVTQASSTQG